MANYRQISTRLWGNDDIQSISLHSTHIFIYFITCTHRNESGLFPITFRTIMHETKISEEALNASLQELAEVNLCHYDRDTKECLIVSAMAWATYKNAHVYASIVRSVLQAKSKRLQRILLERHAESQIIELLRPLVEALSVEIPEAKDRQEVSVSTEPIQRPHSVQTESIELDLALASSLNNRSELRIHRWCDECSVQDDRL